LIGICNLEPQDHYLQAYQKNFFLIAKSEKAKGAFCDLAVDFAG